MVFNKIKDKIFEAIVNKNPIYKAAIKEGREAIALCPHLLLLIEARGPSSVNDRFAEVFEIINQTIKSKNALTLRPYLCDIADSLMAYTVLRKPSLIRWYHDIFIQDCVSGKLSKHVLEISQNNPWLKEQIYSIAGSPDNPDKEYLETFIIGKYEFLLVTYVMLDAARKELKDCNPNYKRDWSFPLLHSLAVCHEVLFQASIGKKYVDPIKAAPYMSFHKLVLDGVKEPTLAFKEQFPKVKGFVWKK
tara:strand:+ start:217 stop:957 length:741 start_codon:yes stop_codon:yes gene_type:complete